MAQLTSVQFRQILQIAAETCGGSPAARARILQFSTELTNGEWNIRSFFIRLANLLGPVPDEIPVFQVVAGQRVPIGNFRYRDAIALLCARLMTRNFGIPNPNASPNAIRESMPMFRPGLWDLVNRDHIGIEHVDGPDDVPPAPLEPPAPAVPLPEINIPEKQTDIITSDPILDGTRMVDFHGEKARHRYYTEETYNALNPKKNPFDRKDILPGDVTRYIAKLDEDMEVQQAGRRKTRKSKKRKTKTRRVRKTRRRHK